MSSRESSTALFPASFDPVTNGHLDIVPVPDDEEWQHPPFEAVVEEGRLHGRGSFDMKGGDAALMWAAARLAEQKDELRGRVMSLFSLVLLGMMPVGSLLVGALAGTIGTPAAVALSGGALGVSVLVIAALRPEVLKL